MRFLKTKGLVGVIYKPVTERERERERERMNVGGDNVQGGCVIVAIQLSSFVGSSYFAVFFKYCFGFFVWIIIHFPTFYLFFIIFFNLLILSMITNGWKWNGFDFFLFVW